MARRPKILILEDDPVLTRQLRRLLTSRGYEVQHVGSVAAFVACAGSERFDTCLLDVSLPDGDGLEAWAAVRARQQDAVAVLMTAHGTMEVERRAAALDVRAMLAKPLDVPVLLSAITPRTKMERTPT